MAKSILFIAVFCGVFHLTCISQCPDLSPESNYVICENAPPSFLPVNYPAQADSVVIQFESDAVRGNFLFNPYGLPVGIHFLPFTYEIYYSNQTNCFGSDSIAVEVVGTVYSIDVLGDSTICLGDDARLFSVEIRNGNENSLPVFWNGSTTEQPFTIVTPLVTTQYYYDYEVASLTIPSFTCSVREFFEVEVFTFSDYVSALGSEASCEFGTASFSFEGLSDSLLFTNVWPDGSSNSAFDTVVTAFTSFPLVVTNENYGCDTSYVFEVAVVDQTEIILDSVFEICAGQELQILPQGGYYYSINNDSIYLDGSAITLRVDSDSTFIIRALREDLFLECTEEMTFDVRMFPFPEIVITDSDSGVFVADSICRGELVSAAVMGAESYDWYSSFNDLSLGNDTSYLLQPDFSTDYFVVGWQYICSDTDTFHIGVKQLPAQEIYYEGPFCEDSLITVWYEESDNVMLWQNQSATNYQDWILRSDTVITLTAVDSYGCVGRDTLVILMNQNPDVQIVAPDTVCVNELFNISVSGALNYQWVSGESDSLISTSIQTDQFFAVTGISAAGCAARDTNVVRAIAIPYLSVTPNTEICRGDSVLLFAFSNGDIVPFIANEPTFISPQIDTSITFVASTLFGCPTSQTVEIVVHPIPSIAITGTPDACPNEELTFQAQGAVTYNWSIESDGSSASLVVTQDSVVYVDGLSEFGCQGSTSFELNARDLPVVEILGDDFICAGGSTVLSGSSEYELLWEGFLADSQIVLNNIFSDTLIQVIATNDYGCSSAFEKWVVVAEITPDVTILGDDSLCSGENTVLTAAGDAVFFWFDSLNTTQLNLIGLTTDTVIYFTAFNSLGCQTTVYKTIHVFPFPSLDLDDNLFSCEGQWLTVNANSNVPVLWSDGVVAPYRQLSVINDTTFSAIALGENYCLSYDTVHVGIAPLPDIFITEVQSVCTGDTLTLEAQGGSSYLWSTGEVGGSISVVASPNQTYSVTGANDEGCTDVDVISPVVTGPLTIQLNFSQDTICDFGGNVALTMNPSGGILSGDDVVNGIFNPSGPGYYELTYVVESPDGCVSTAQEQLTIESCVGLIEVIESNAFQPYPNPGNGIITWSGDIMCLQVFNGIGTMVLETSVFDRSADLSELSAGNYILIGRSKNGINLPAVRYTIIE